MYQALLILGAAAAAAIPAPAVVDAQELLLSPEQVSRLEIKLEQVRPTSTEVVAVLPATVVRPPNAHVVATAPFAGTVKQVLALPGQRVSKGTLLARVSSRDLLEAQSQFAQAEAELQNAEAIARRKRTMADKKLQSETLAAEAEAQVARYEAVVERYRRTLTLNGITAEEGGEYAIPATQDGTVIEIDIMPGDKIEAMGSVVSLDTSDELWAEVQVPAETVAKVKPGDPVQLENGQEGRVISIGTSIDPKSRSSLMYVELPKGIALLPGQMITLRLMRKTTAEGYSVPAPAVTRVDDKNIVFVRTDAGFSAHAVSLLAKSASVATIAGDLPPGARVAATGVPQLEQLLAGE